MNMNANPVTSRHRRVTNYMAALRCLDCDVAWPAELREYERCPSCLVRTSWSHGSDPLDPRVALSMKRHYDCERFCIARDARQAQLLDELEHTFALDDDRVCSD